MALTPLSLQNYDLSNPAQAKQYQYQMMVFLNGLLAQFNALQGQIGTANLTPSTSNLGALSGNTTFNASNSLVVSLTFTFAVALTLTIQNLPIGSVVLLNFTQTSAAAKVLTGVATTPTGTNYISWVAETGATTQNFLTGWNVSAAAQHICVGVTAAGPALNMVAQ